MAKFSQLSIVSNFSLKLDDIVAENFDLNKFLKAEYENCVIILDEAYTYLESRISQSELNRIMSYILFQSRKKNVTIYLTAQLFSTIDKRFRELSEIIVIADRNGIDFTYYISNKEKTRKIVIPFIKAKAFFNTYDTNEVIYERNEKLEFKLKDSDEKFNDINVIAKEVREHYNSIGLVKITRDMVKLYFTIKGIPSFLISDVHTILNLNKVKKSQQVKKR